MKHHFINQLNVKLPKLKNWYHATDINTADKIIETGYLMPQPHGDNFSLGIFFANTMENAAWWMRLRGITDFVVFKIPRTRLNTKKIVLSEADKMPKELNMICMRHLDKIKIKSSDGQICHSPEFKLPGVKIINDGTKRIAMEIEDIAEFEAYIKSNPELKQQIEEEIQKLEETA